MPTSSPMLPLWVVAPIGILTLLVLAGHFLAIRTSVVDARRRRIRAASSGLLMLTVPIFCYGLTGTSPARSREFVLVWLMIAVLLLFVIMLALTDLIHTMQLHRAHLRELRQSIWVSRQPGKPAAGAAEHHEPLA